MRSLSITKTGILISGSSGFVGRNLCTRAEGISGPVETSVADVLDRARMLALASQWRAHAAIHLAGVGRVLTPTCEATEMFASSVEGTVNLLGSFCPKVGIMASTCAVYGNTSDEGAEPGLTLPNPLGLYGVARRAAELTATTWAAETGSTAIIFRLGNVIGEGCAGLIRYLVDHAVRHPRGDVPAQLRGGGKIIRDYVPVAHVARLLLEAARHDWGDTREVFLNLGTGRGTANGQIAEIAVGLLAARGYELRISYASEPGRGEAMQSILNSTETTRQFGIPPPDESKVVADIEAAVLFHLEQRIASAQNGFSLVAHGRTN